MGIESLLHDEQTAVNIDFLDKEEDYKRIIQHHGFKQNIEGVTRRLGNSGTCIDHINSDVGLLEILLCGARTPALL